MPSSRKRATPVAPLPSELSLSHGALPDPATLAPIASQAMQDLLAEGESANTTRSYQTALRYWAAWFWLRYRRHIAVPVPPAAVIQFIVDHAERRSGAKLAVEMPAAVDEALVAGGFKASVGAPALATLLHRLSVLSKAHRLKGGVNPVQDPDVRELMARTRRAYAKRGVMPDKKAAITLEPLEAMLATCDDSLRGVRDRALLLFAWSSGGRRRSEVTAATMENVKRVAPRTYIYTLGQSKTNQTGDERPDDDKPIVEGAADALEAWLDRSGVTTGAIFRRLRVGDRIAEPLAPAAVRDIVRARASLAGLPPDLSAHSLRSGFVTEAARQNVPIGETMALTGHSSIATVIGYFRSAQGVQSRAARLLGDVSTD